MTFAHVDRIGSTPLSAVLSHKVTKFAPLLDRVAQVSFFCLGLNCFAVRCVYNRQDKRCKAFISECNTVSTKFLDIVQNSPLVSNFVRVNYNCTWRKYSTFIHFIGKMNSMISKMCWFLFVVELFLIHKALRTLFYITWLDERILTGATHDLAACVRVHSDENNLAKNVP